MSKEEHLKKMKEAELNPALVCRPDVPTTTGKILKRSRLIKREIEGLPYYIFPIMDNEVDTGMYIIAWPN